MRVEQSIGFINPSIAAEIEGSKGIATEETKSSTMPMPQKAPLEELPAELSKFIRVGGDGGAFLQKQVLCNEDLGLTKNKHQDFNMEKHFPVGAITQSPSDALKFAESQRSNSDDKEALLKMANSEHTNVPPHMRLSELKSLDSEVAFIEPKNEKNQTFELEKHFPIGAITQSPSESLEFLASKRSNSDDKEALLKIANSEHTNVPPHMRLSDLKSLDSEVAFIDQEQGGKRSLDSDLSSMIGLLSKGPNIDDIASTMSKSSGEANPLSKMFAIKQVEDIADTSRQGIPREVFELPNSGPIGLEPMLSVEIAED